MSGRFAAILCAVDNLGEGRIQQSADPTHVAISIRVGSSLTLDPTYKGLSAARLDLGA